MTVAIMGWIDDFVTPQPNWGMLEDPSQQNNRPFTWWGWDELVNFRRIRHVFGHSLIGNIQANLESNLQDFQTKLGNGQIKYKWLDPITGDEKSRSTYYKINNNRIILDKDAIIACATTVISYALADPDNNIQSINDVPIDISNIL